MRSFLRLLLVGGFILSWGQASAQDSHFTLFDMSQLRLNPAYTGAYEGTARIGGIYRNQWLTALDTNSFNSRVIYLDAPIVRGFRKQDWVGIGSYQMGGEAGAGNLETQKTALSLAYHLGLNKTTRLTLAGNYGRSQKTVEASSFRFEDDIKADLGIIDPSQKAIEQSSIRTPVERINSVGAGFMLRTAIDKQNLLEIGGSLDNINKPRASQLGRSTIDTMITPVDNSKVRLPMLVGFHAKYKTVINEKFILTPTFYYQTNEGGGNEIALQTWIGKPFKQGVIHGGLGYRVGDALQILGMYDMDDLRVAASFDVNLSKFTPASKGVGSFEVAAYYILKMYKKPIVKPAILCPEF